MRPETNSIVARLLFAALTFVFLVFLLPELALSFGDVRSGFGDVRSTRLGSWAYFWPQRAFPKGFQTFHGDYFVQHLYRYAFVIAIDFWVVLSSVIIYTTRHQSFGRFAGILIFLILAIELAFTYAICLFGYRPILGFI